MQNLFRKIFYYEYWPWQIFYIPLYPYLVFLILKHKTAFTFSAINSGISPDSGLFTANKNIILKAVPPEYKPKECLIHVTDSAESAILEIQKLGLEYPIICKPTFGKRGKNVVKVEDVETFKKYKDGIKESFIIQEFIDLDEEFGIVFFKHPDTGVVEITSIGQKEFLSVVGDGKSSVLNLLKKSSRGRIYLNKIGEKYPDLVTKVLDKGVKQIVEPIGNHCRGTKFIDRNDLLGKGQLLRKIENIVSPLENINFGRLDVKASSEEGLLSKEGKIVVFEINGAHAEPSHIYDPNNTIFKAYKDLFTQWDKIFTYGKICANNGIPFLNMKKFVSLAFQKTNETKILINPII